MPPPRQKFLTRLLPFGYRRGNGHPEGISQAVGWLSPSDVLGSGLFDAVLPLTMLQDETGAQVQKNTLPRGPLPMMVVVVVAADSLLW